MGGRMGGGRRGGAMGGGSSGGGNVRRMAQAPRTPQKRRARRQERREARREQRMAQAESPMTTSQRSGPLETGNEDWFGDSFGADSLFSDPQEPKDFRSVEFDTASLQDPYRKYADDPESGWITGLMKSGQKGYDLPREVTLAAAMNSPFRYYGGY